ncbi:MAG: Fur family transcriptional regulator [Elusimicrobiota bacterium]
MPRKRNRRRLGGAFRWTEPRQTVLEVIKNTDSHLSAEDVFIRAKKINPGIGIATVYRNLEFLKDQGILKKYQFGEGKSRYELKDDEDSKHHHHLVCTFCGKIIDYSEFVNREKKLVNDLKKELSKKHKFDINTHQLHFYGVCSKCKNKGGE